MRRLGLLIILAIFPVIVNSQESRFLKYYALVNGNNQGEAIRFLSDSSLLVGTISVYNDDNGDQYTGMGLYNLSKDGSENYSLLQLEEGNTLGLFFQMIIPDFENGFIVSPGYNNYVDNQLGDYLLIKYSNDGEVIWSKDWGTQASELIYSICKMPNGNIAVAGITDEFDNYYDISVFILDSLGNILHSNIFGWEGQESVKSLTALADTTLILGGSSMNIDPYHESYEGIMLRLNSSGDSLYSNIYYGYPQHGICNFKTFKDGLLRRSIIDTIIVGTNDELVPYIAFQDLFGTEIWKTYIVRPENTVLWDFQVAINKEIIFTGTDNDLPLNIYDYADFSKEYIGCIGKLDSMGNLLWYKRYVLADSRHSDNFHALSSDAAGNIYITGWGHIDVDSLSYLISPTVLLKLGPDGCFEPGCTDEVLYLRGDSTYVVGLDTITAIQQQFIHQSYFTISPNPITQGGQAVMRLYNALQSDAELRIYDASAKVLRAYVVPAGTKEYTLSDLAGIASGVYYVSYVKDEKIIETKKVVVSR
jgi:hypothetical protein